MDVVQLYICGIFLGSINLYDKKEIFLQHENKYHLTKNGVEYIVRYHGMNISANLIHER